ncbi:hypothetical protein JTB14_015528 [Gonioctena quinquepunctata]|nr:hypothetical protein JTB14_015528 [Gonioctena quinquepunctata]
MICPRRCIQQRIARLQPTHMGSRDSGKQCGSEMSQGKFPARHEWRTGNHKRKRSSLIIGLNNSNSTTLKEVPETAVLHVRSLNTTAKILRNFIEPHIPIRTELREKYSIFPPRRKTISQPHHL